MHHGQAIILGALQGITEFLPISSSGHLLLLQQIWRLSAPPIVIDISLHLGTLIALLFAFRKDLYDLLRHPRDPMWVLLIAGTIPTVVIAILFQSFIEKAFQTGNTLGLEFIVTGIFLLLSESRQKGEITDTHSLGITKAILIGCAQGAAILPALSRSGLTMAAAIGLGVPRSQAVRFSFLLSIPAILGASIFTAKDLTVIPTDIYPSLVIAMVASALFGYLSIRFLLQWVSRHSVKPFGYYTLTLGSLLVMNQWFFHR